MEGEKRTLLKPCISVSRSQGQLYVDDETVRRANVAEDKPSSRSARRTSPRK